MDSKHQDNLLALSQLLNRFLTIGFFAMTLLSVALGGALAYVAGTQSRTLVPPSISQAFSISNTAVDAPYLQLMGEFFLKLKLNVTPANVTRQYGLLLNYVPEDNWSQVQPALIADAQRIQKNNASSRFDALPGKTHISLDAMQFKQTGTLVKTVGDRTLPEETVTYVVQMRYDRGFIELIGIKQEGGR